MDRENVLVNVGHVIGISETEILLKDIALKLVEQREMM